jgi:hypothetical protein
MSLGILSTDIMSNVARRGEMRNEYYILVGKIEGKRPLRRRRGRREDIRMDFG